MNDEVLKLENQLCFPLYACAKEVVRKYTPYLKELNLTYTQYIVMLVLWEQQQLAVKDLGKYLYLDSGTLTPLLKKLEFFGFVQRTRDRNDERTVIISVTEAGMNLQEKAVPVQRKLEESLNISLDETKMLYSLLYKILDNLKVETY